MLIGMALQAQTQEVSPLLSSLLPPDTLAECHPLHSQAICPRLLRNGSHSWQIFPLLALSTESRYSCRDSDYYPLDCGSGSSYFFQRCRLGSSTQSGPRSLPFYQIHPTFSISNIPFFNSLLLSIAGVLDSLTHHPPMA